jgi:hypothetical protein
VEFNSLPDSEVSLQNRIDLAEDGDTIFIHAGYYGLDETIYVDKNITAIGNGVIVVDAKRDFGTSHIEDPNLSVTIKNLIFVNGISEHGGAINSVPKDLALVNCTFRNNVAIGEGWCIANLGGHVFIGNSAFYHNYAVSRKSRGGAIYDNTTTIRNMITSGVNRDLTPLVVRNRIFYGDKAGLLGAAIYIDGREL